MIKKQARIGWFTVIALSILSLSVGILLLARVIEWIDTMRDGAEALITYRSLIGGIVCAFAIPIALIGGFAFRRAKDPKEQQETRRRQRAFGKVISIVLGILSVLVGVGISFGSTNNPAPTQLCLAALLVLFVPFLLIAGFSFWRVKNSKEREEAK